MIHMKRCHSESRISYHHKSGKDCLKEEIIKILLFFDQNITRDKKNVIRDKERKILEQWST